jgi:hypothetical protein
LEEDSGGDWGSERAEREAATAAEVRAAVGLAMVEGDSDLEAKVREVEAMAREEAGRATAAAATVGERVEEVAVHGS